MKLPKLNNNDLKTIIVLAVTAAWFAAAIVGLVYPERKIDNSISAIMVSVVGAIVADKAVQAFRDKEKEK